MITGSTYLLLKCEGREDGLNINRSHVDIEEVN
jgi:hypothetical protein